MSDMLEIAKEQKILQCFYCGNKTLMNMVGRHKYHWESDDGSFRGYSIYRLYACPVCEDVTFHRTYWEDGMYDRNGQMYEEDEILYPVNTLHTNAIQKK